MYNLLLSGYLSDLVEEPTKWLTIGLLGALLLIIRVFLKSTTERILVINLKICILF